MGEPIKNILSKPVLHDHPVIKKRTHPKCGKDEYVYINEDGREKCLPEELRGLVGLLPGGITCGEGGGIPCNYGEPGITVEQALEQMKLFYPEDQYIPPDTITQTAVYECGKGHYVKGFTPYGGEGETEREVKDPSVYKKASVTIRIIPGESTKATKNRFEKAAEIELRGMKFRGESSNCSSFRFLRFLPVLPKIEGSR